MLKDFLREVAALIVGKSLEGISELLLSKKHVNEFLIAKKMGLTINQTRNLLYRFSEKGVVSYIRKKDKKKGWYTYYWKFENVKALEFLKNIRLRQKEHLENQIENRESKVFYVCERCNIELNESSALLYDFTCDECGDIFVVKNNEPILKQLKKNLKKVEDDLERLEIELKKEKEKLEKEKAKLLPAKKTAKKTAKKSVKKTAKKAASKKAAKKSVKKAAKKAAKKTAKKSVKKTAKK